MDVNGTRFHLVLHDREWLGPDASPATTGVSAADGWLQLRADVPLFPPRRGEREPEQAQRRGGGRDRYGNWYWIAEDRREIRTMPAERRSGVHFWSADDSRVPTTQAAGAFARAISGGDASDLAGLAVTTDHYLVAGRTAPGGLLVFDLHGGGAPIELRWPADVPFAPHDLAATADGGLWVLDREHALLWRLDRYFRVVSPTPLAPAPRGAFAPVGAASGPAEATLTHDVSGATLRAARSLALLASPLAVEALPDGSVLVLDDAPAGPASVVARYGPHHEGPQLVALDESLAGGSLVGEAGDETRHPLPLRAYDFAAVATADARRGMAGTLYGVAPDGNQAIALDLSVRGTHFTLRLRPDYLPMRRFSGRGIVGSAGQVYYDSADRWLPLVEQPNPRYATTGTLQLPATAEAFDGREPQCVWHRLVFEGCLPADGRIVVACRAADAVASLAALPWREQPSPYRRGTGSELPWYEPALESSGQAGTYELLFQDVVGRHLQIRLTLAGNGRVSPRLRALRIWYPRFSYLREYLPAAYRDDRTSASFLDRYLANVEGTFTTIEDRIAQVQTLLDVNTVPARFLDWLAGWFGITLDAGWDERTRRLFLANAPQYFRERGTYAGMIRALRMGLATTPDASLFADAPCARATPGFGVRIVEGFGARRRSTLALGDPGDSLGETLLDDAFAWTPAEGAEPLHRRWRAYLRGRYGTAQALADAWCTDVVELDDPSLRLPAVRPDDCRRTDWVRFIQRELGFVYAVVTDADEPLYREFLARRYRHPSDVNAAYGLTAAAALASFADVPARLWAPVLRSALPSGGAMLRDWMQFATVVLPLDRGAHRFTVLVPVGLDDTIEDQRSRRDVASRIARLEKPAHTDFDVQLYWGMFRAGEARLGLDTVLGPGSRAVAIVLDHALLGAGYLGAPDGARAPDRMTVTDEILHAPAPAACCAQS